MIPFKAYSLFILLSLCIFTRAESIVEKNQELYVLKRDGSRFLVMVLEEQEKNSGSRVGWIEVNLDHPEVQFFTSKPDEDKIAFLTTDIEKTYYLKLNEDLPLTEDHKAFEILRKGNPSWNKNLFLGLDQYVPISNSGVAQASTDVTKSCPTHPQKKNGDPCAKRMAFDLPQDFLKEIVLVTQALNKETGSSIEPALVASIIHHETDFNLFAENLHEKKQCESGECSDYGWGKGFAQLGKTDSSPYGINWDIDPPKFRKCKKGTPISSRCFDQVDSYCQKKFKNSKLMPYFCPRAAIKAVALKLSRLIPTVSEVYLRDGKGALYKTNLTPFLTQDKNTEIRNRVAAYNRRTARVLNSYSQFIQQNGKGPSEFGEAWSTLRDGNNTPTRNIGYGMLTREFINRCYVWNVAGLCGEIPENSLIDSYRDQLKGLQ